MSTSDNTTDKRDVYARVTHQIVTAIENGVSNWRMPWHTSGRFAFSPINVTSKKPYRGINTVCLWASARLRAMIGANGERISNGRNAGDRSARVRRPR